jgi:hypothetical protein
MASEGFWRWFDRAARMDFAANVVGWFWDWRAWTLSTVAAVMGGIISKLDGWSNTVVFLSTLSAGLIVAIVFALLKWAFSSRTSTKDLFPEQHVLTSKTELPIPPDPYPDWPIHELFTHIDPGLLSRTDESVGDTWDNIGNDIKDHASLGRLKIWGRPIEDSLGKILGERPPLRRIDPSYWHSSHFTYHFFDSTAGDEPHTYVLRNSGLPEYTDLRVNRPEATALWSRSQTPTGLSPKEPDIEVFLASLYVPDIEFQWPDLESKGVLYITVKGRSTEDVSLRTIEGNISVKRSHTAVNLTETELGSLSTPRFYKMRQMHFDASREFFFTLEQEIPERLAKEMLNWRDGINYIFNFQKLHVFIQSSADPKKVAPLPLWDFASTRKQGGGILATRGWVLDDLNKLRQLPIIQ